MDIEAHIANHGFAIAIGGGDISKADHRGRARRYGRLLWPLEAANRPQRLGIILARRVEHCARVGFLHLVTAKQNLHPVGHLRHHGQIVGDIDRRRLELLDDLPDCNQHFNLCRHVERGCRFIEDDQVRTA